MRFSPSRLLRSRRLAVGLLLAVVVWSVAASLVPQLTLGKGGAEVAAWDKAHPVLAVVARLLGLHRAFSAPLFVGMVVLLAAATAACSWERTCAAVRDRRRMGTVTDAGARRLREAPDLVIPLGGSQGAPPLALAADALRHLRLRVRSGPRVLVASSGPARLLASPVFHWLLTLLFIVVALGRLTRAEGLVGVPLGSRVPDAAASYGLLEEGPLYGGHSGLRFGAEDLVLDFRDAEGNRRGAAPVVTLYRGETPVARRRVYPNSPLRHGDLLVHMSGYGLAARFSLESSGGVAAGETVDSLVDFDALEPSGTTRQRLDLADIDGRPLQTFELTIPVDRDGRTPIERLPRDPRVEFRAGGGATSVLRPGQVTLLQGGHRLKLVSIGYYARLSVADDWSIYPMYLLFVLTGVAMSVSVFAPMRTVRVLLWDGADGQALHVVAWHGRKDPLFLERVKDGLRRTAGGRTSEKEDTA